MGNINSSTPANISLGAQDNSTRLVPSSDTVLPQCVSLFYIQARKGTTDRFYGNKSEAVAMFGNETFDATSKYYNHHTRLANKIASAGGNIMYQRVIDPSNTVKANVRVWLDVLKTKIPNYKRNSGGDFLVENDRYQLDDVNPYVDGYYLKWYKSHDSSENLPNGSSSVRSGGMVKWKMTQDDESKKELHIVKTKTNITDANTGHTEYANTTVYVYDSEEEMYLPSINASKRYKYEVKEDGSYETPTLETLGVTSGVTERSKLYPILETQASNVGEWYNLVGFALESALGSSASVPVMNKLKAYPYKFYIYNKSTPTSSPKPMFNLDGDTSTDCVLKQGAISPVTNREFSLEYVSEYKYYNEKNDKLKIVYTDMEPIYFYADNFNSILQAIMQNEKEYISLEQKSFSDGEKSSTFKWFDYTTDEKEELINNEYGLINPFTCTSSQGVRYFTVAYNLMDKPTEMDGFIEINLMKKTPIFLMGGIDGNLSVEKYEQFIVDDMDHYSNENSIYMDQSVNKETFIWDNGFSLDTKKALAKFISVRKDTVAVLSTVYEKENTIITSPAEQLAIGSTLVQQLTQYLESETFGTSAVRGAVVMGTGRELTSSKRISLVEDIAVKTVKLMGGTSNKWNGDYRFDNYPNNEVSELVDIEPKQLVQSMQTSLWENRINYPLPNQKKGHFFPALRTIYGNDTSIATSYINMLALSYCERVAYQTWLHFTGTMSLTQAQFMASVENYANSLLTTAFSSLLTANAECIISEADEARGYTWQLKVSLYGNNMKTKQVSWTALYRNDSSRE